MVGPAQTDLSTLRINISTPNVKPAKQRVTKRMFESDVTGEVGKVRPSMSWKMKVEQ